MAALTTPECIADMRRIALFSPDDPQAVGSAVICEIMACALHGKIERKGDTSSSVDDRAAKSRSLVDALPAESRKSVCGGIERLEQLTKDPDKVTAAAASEILAELVMIINTMGEDLGVSSPIPSKEEDTTAKMLEHLRRAVRLDPSRERAWDLLTVILLDKKETDEALTVARRRIEFKDNAHNRFLLAKVYAASNQFDKAAEELRAGLKNNSKDLNCHLGLIALVLKRDDERALQDARKRFAVIAPRMKEEKNKQCWLSYFLLRGIHYGLCDRPDWAREWFKQVLRRINGETTATRALAALGEPLGLAEQQLAIDYIEERRGRVARADAQIASPVERVSLCGDQITDEDLFVLTAFPDLHELNLSMTAITDAGLAHLKTLHHLHELDLSNTTITDVGLAQLTELKDLRRLLLGSTRITPRGIAELRKALPKLEVSR
jgi:hypothetical protein